MGYVSVDSNVKPITDREAKIIELRQGIQKFQAKTLVGTTLVLQPCRPIACLMRY